MKESVFNPKQQEQHLSSKIVVGLERISQAFKVLLWDKAKEYGLSPIQIQILVFISYHKDDLNNVSLLAKEFNVTKPTISDAVKVLDKKGLVVKEYSATDSRSFHIFPSEKGKQIVAATESFAEPITEQFEILGEGEKVQFFNTLSKLIFRLNKRGILTVQRTCTSCRFYQKTDALHYCALLQTSLADAEIRLDCPEFEAKS